MARFSLGVNRDFVAQHYLVGGDFGPEGELHSHHYRVEFVLEGDELDEHGFLMNIVDVKEALDALVARFRDRTLNDDPAFAGRNTGCEAFASTLAESLQNALDVERLSALSVKVWEDDEAWARCAIDLQESP